MQTKSLFRHLLCDETSLREYMEGNVASYEDVQDVCLSWNARKIYLYLTITIGC